MSPSAMSHIAYPGIAIYFETDYEEVFSFSRVQKPDEGWKYIDKNGHAHVWIDDKLPTLDRVSDGVGYYEDGTEYTKWKHVCTVCGEEIKPGFKWVDAPQYIQGLPRWTLDLGGNRYPIDEKDVGPLVEILQRCGVIKNG